MQRREFMGGVAALAATRWDGEDYDIENAENWEPPTGGTFQTGTFTPTLVTTSADGQIGGWLLEDTDFTERTMEVFYDADGVHLTIEGKGDGVRGGGLAELDTDQARDLAAALYQAAEELDRRPEVDDADQ